MLQTILRRLVFLLPLMFFVSLIVFSLLLMVPGDPVSVILGDHATLEEIAAARQRLGLDDPVHIRYGRWLGKAITGDLGTSLFNSYPVTQAIVDRLPVTLSLVGLALLISIVFGVPAGVIAGSRRGSLLDRFLTIGASGGVAMPNFWLGLVLALIFGLWLRWFPATGYVDIRQDFVQWLQHISLPAVALAASTSAELVRQTRASMIDALEQDYVRTARAKGLWESGVLVRHALKNAMIPVVTVGGLAVSRTYGMSIIIEQIFGMQGVGSLAIRAVFDRDIPMIQGVVLMTTVLVLLINLIVDISYTYFDPRTRTA